jgi:DNA-dependent protein kinase catalytic subunit
MYTYAPKNEVEKQLVKQHSTLPSDLLQKGIAALSSSPETYLLIRTQFARTLAVFSIASYIIGIGDRHLENFLLNHTEYCQV